VLPLFAITLFVSATLLFWVQPMFSRMVLPALGGSPAVWNTAMVFFQTALLVGYLYAHLISRWLGLRRQVALHLLLLALAALTLPIGVAAGWTPPTEGTPVIWLIGLLAWCLGLPFVVVSATAPLLQKWFAASGHPAAADPYFLYGASNLGSILALLGYPLLLEPALTLARQNEAWALGYAGLAVLVAGCGLAVWRRPQVCDANDASPEPGARTVGWGQRLHWLALAFAPSSLLLAVTAHITTDLASVPLLWVVPLTLYLLTFVIVFARRPVLRHGWMVKAQPFIIIPLALMFDQTAAFRLVLPLHLAAFFVSAMVCHGELARRRPATSHLTEFYLWMAFGGMLGGVFNALLAPVMFDSVLEYPIALVIACLLRPTLDRGRGGLLATLALPFLVFLLMLLWRHVGPSDLGTAGVLAVLVPIALLLYSFAAQPLRFGLGIAAVLGVALVAGEPNQVEARARSFFGVYTIRHDSTGYRVLVHGTTVHGAEHTDPNNRREPLTYYHRAGPLGQIFAAFADHPPHAVAAVGLGVGTVACYRRPGQRWTFFEIDPLVERIARDARHFHYLEDCAPDADVVLGDARRSLQVETGPYDLMILDAFSSDAIPVHLLTREAFALYLDKLAPGGLIALHISNRNLDLAPVVASLLADAGLVGRLQTQVPSLEAQRAYRNAATWVAIARDEADLGALADDPRWQAVPAGTAPPWTDDFSNLVGALRWRL
jgi:spermidine synthase